MLILAGGRPLFSFLSISACFMPLSSALPGPGLETIDHPEIIPIVSFLQTSDTICQLWFQSSIRQVYGFDSYLIKAVKSFGAQNYRGSKNMATFYCGDGRTTGDLPAGEVRTRGPFLMTCVPGKEIRLTHQTRGLPANAYQPVHKAFCGKPRQEEKGKGPEPDPELEPEPEDDEPDTTLRLSRTIVKSGTTDCLQTMSIDADWLKMSFSTWTTPMTTKKILPFGTIDKLLYPPQELTWGLVHAPIDTIEHFPRTGHETFYPTRGGLGGTYRACARIGLGRPNMILYMDPSLPGRL